VIPNILLPVPGVIRLLKTQQKKCIPFEKGGKIEEESRSSQRGGKTLQKQ